MSRIPHLTKPQYAAVLRTSWAGELYRSYGKFTTLRPSLVHYRVPNGSAWPIRKAHISTAAAEPELDVSEDSTRRRKYPSSQNTFASVLQATGQSFTIFTPSSRSFKYPTAILQPNKLTLKSIVAQHILHIHLRGDVFSGQDGSGLELDGALEKLYNDETLSFLHSRGYSIQDVESWSWILCSKTLDHAVQRLDQLNRKSSESRPKFPLTLLLYLLRAKMVSPLSVRILLDQSWSYYRDQFAALPAAEGSTPEHRQSRWGNMIDEPSTMILVARLLRHARKVLPEAITEIAELACFALRGKAIENTDRPGTITAISTQRLSTYYNRILSLISIPTSQRPYLSTHIQEEAQFRILAQMTKFSPHIPINRVGFQAILQTQLSRKKTDAERDYIQYQAITWPPWKRDKSGLDVDRFFEGSLSRATRVINQMREAGYEPRKWESIAQILAGWDLDGSPTIQTRKLVPLLQKEMPTWKYEARLAQARILATRTVKEAWASLLEYERLLKEDQRALKRGIWPYTAMLERILAKEISRDIGPIIGDVVERYPEPTSPHDFMYVSEDPPTPSQLVERALAAGLYPNFAMIQGLLKVQTDLASIITVLRLHPLYRQAVPFLLNVEKYDSYTFKKHLKLLPNPIITAVISSLANSSLSSKDFQHQRTADDDFISRDGPANILFDDTLIESCGRNSAQIDKIGPRDYAHCILKLGKVHVMSAWTELLRGSLTRLPVRDASTSISGINFGTWSSIKSVLSDMNALKTTFDFKTFDLICDALVDVLPAHQGDHHHTADQVNEDFLILVTDHFSRLVTGQPSWEITCQAKPSGDLATPDPFSLLVFFRILGLLQKHDMMIQLMRWMIERRSKISKVSRESWSGPRKLREILITIRIHLENLWSDTEFLYGAPPSTTSDHNPLLEEAKVLVQKVPQWGGWPTDDEVRSHLWDITGSNDWRVRMRRAGQLNDFHNDEQDGNHIVERRQHQQQQHHRPLHQQTHSSG